MILTLVVVSVSVVLIFAASLKQPKSSRHAGSEDVPNSGWFSIFGSSDSLHHCDSSHHHQDSSAHHAGDADNSHHGGSDGGGFDDGGSFGGHH